MRLTKFNSLVGNTTTKNIIMKSLESNGFPQASLNSGPSGSGKSNCAEITALRLTCENPIGCEPCGSCHSCVNGINAIKTGKSSRKIRKINLAHIQDNEDIRKLIQEVFKIDNGGETTVRIFEEAHSLSALHQTALLEELDRVPEDVYVILCTTKPNSLLRELRNRLVEFKFNNLTPMQSRLLIDKQCEVLELNIKENTKNVIRTHSKGVPREIIKSLSFIKNNRSISEKEFNEYFGEADSETIRLMLKSYSDIGESVRLMDSLLEKMSVLELIDRLKEYLMDCAFLSKDISYKETLLKPDDKRFSKTLGFKNILKIYNQVDLLRRDSELCDLQYCLIKCCGIVNNAIKESMLSQGFDDSELMRPKNSISKDIESKKERSETLKESSKFTKSLGLASFGDIIDENVSKK